MRASALRLAEASIGKVLGCAVYAKLDDSDPSLIWAWPRAAHTAAPATRSIGARGIAAERQCEDEGADIDNGDTWAGGASLGALAGAGNQTLWAQGWGDLKLDESDEEPDLEWSNPLGAQADGRGGLKEERVPDRLVRRARAVTRHVTNSVTRDAAVRP